MNSLLISKVVSIIGLASYMTISVINNSLDKKTNHYFLKNMFNMHHLVTDPVLGKGLLHRAITNESFVSCLLNIIILFQIVISILLWTSVAGFIASLFSENYFFVFKSLAIYALTAFMSLWFFFWCGGFWFGYWIKTPQIQEVHMKLVMISILEIIFINL